MDSNVACLFPEFFILYSEQNRWKNSVGLRNQTLLC